MIYAPAFTECDQCGSFWDARRADVRLCPVCVQTIRRRALEEQAHVDLAETLKGLGVFLTVAAVIVAAFLLWRHP